MGLTRDELNRVLPDRYHLEEEIGRGGMATVFRAEDRKVGRPVAIKILHSDVSHSVRRERFLREIQVSKTLIHPNILPVYDSGSANDLIFYTMPFVEGESLRDRLTREGALPVPTVLQITGDVASALDFAHTRNVVHRDIKPENILLQGDRALVADFGVALGRSEAGAERLTQTGVAVGTPAYMSPEQGTGGHHVDRRSDLYSLACVVYEMLGGEPPFIGKTPQAVIARHVSEPLPSLRVLRPSLPSTVEATLRRALSKMAADRQPTAGAFLRELREAAETPDRRNRRIPAAAIGAMLVSAVVIAVAFPRIRQGISGGAESSVWFSRTEIAARPFSDETSTGTYGWLGGGLASDIVDALNEVERLSARPLSAARAFPPDRFPVDSLGKRLRVGTLVDGRIDDPPDSIRVSVYLLDTRTGAQLGSVIRETAPAGQEGRLRAGIIDKLSRQLRQTLGAEVQLASWRAETSSSEAWSSVTRARGIQQAADSMASEGAIELAMQALNEAERLALEASRADPEWPRPEIVQGRILLQRVAITERATVTGRLAESDTASVMEWIRAAASRAENALALGGAESEALEIEGGARLQEWRWTSPPRPDSLLDLARVPLLAATREDPGRARAWLDLSTIYQYQGDFAEGRRATQNAIHADAWLEETQRAIIREMFDALREGEVRTATDDCRFGEENFPRNPDFLQCRLVLLGWQGTQPRDVAAAWELLGRVEAHPNAARITTGGWQYRRIMVAAVAARAGMPDSARAIVDRTRAPPWGSQVDPHWLFYEAWVEALSGRHATALQLLERYLEYQPTYRSYVRDHPWFEMLRTDPRFLELTASG